MPTIDRIDDVIAGDYWEYKTSNGESVTCRVEVGRPTFVVEGEWCCPVFIQGFTPKISLAYGVGPVDALMNAAMLIRTFADKIGPFSPGAPKPN